MVTWLSRREKIASFDYYQSWMESDETESKSLGSLESQLVETDDHEEEIDVQLTKAHRDVPDMLKPVQPTIRLAKMPHEPRKSLLCIILSHAAPDFPTQLKLFLNDLLPADQKVSKTTALESSLPFSSLDVWHQYKFMPVSLFTDDTSMMQEVVKAIPITKRSSHLQFDTVIVLDSDKAESTAVQGKLLFHIYIPMLTGCRL